MLHVLNIISSNDLSNSAAMSRFAERPLRTHEVLQELRDISSMAIDHFEEKIAPALKKAYCELPSRSLLCSSSIQFQCEWVYRCNWTTKLILIFSPIRFARCQSGLIMFVNASILYAFAAERCIDIVTPTCKCAHTWCKPKQLHTNEAQI